MRKVIVFMIFLIILFIVNIGFYFLSEDYRTFLKELKDKDNTIDLQEKSFSDSLAKENISNTLIVDVNKKKLEKTDKKSEKIDKSEGSGTTKMVDEVDLGKNYLDVIDVFSSYGINKLHVNSSLFDVTDEYPDNYFEYYSKNLTLYLFPTKSYSDVHDIFSVLSSELPFKIKEVNNFGEKSFYINLNNDIQDRFIRMVISNKGIVFGLKIEKTQYDLVKEKLNSLKIQ